MTGRTPWMPRPLTWTLLLGLVGLAFAVPFSAPDGTGMQWDELVLGTVSWSCAVLVFRRLRVMEGSAAVPWWPPAVGAVAFAISQYLAGFFPGPAFDGFGVDDVILFLGATSPLVTCALLARRLRRTRWSALFVDGAMTTVALLVLTEVLRTPIVNPVDAPDDLRSLVLAYGGYTAVMLGGAGALCTVATTELRRAATTVIGAATCQAVAAACEAMAIVAPSPLWTTASDVCVATSLVAATLAAYRAPVRFVERGARASAPQVSPAGLALVIVAVLGLPVAIILSLLQGQDMSPPARLGLVAIFVLMALRLVLRIRDDGRLSEDLVRSEEDFRGLIEASSDGIAVMDPTFRLLFTSPAARNLLGIDAETAARVSLLDLVVPEDRERVLTATAEQPAGEGPPLHVRVGSDPVRELEITSSERPGSGRRVIYLRDVTTSRRRERELERMAYTDHLTALPNRAMLFQELATPTAQLRSLLVLDLDGFKAVNDVAGHEAGDHLLVEVAHRLQTVVRDDDLIARLGGDEFAVIVGGSSADAQEVAQRIVDVMALPHRSADGTFALGASVGVATVSAAGGQAAFREADAALRAAKQAGKGCVRVANEARTLLVDPGEEFERVLAESTLSLRLDAACRPDGGIDMLHAVPVFQHPEHPTLRGLDLWGTAERYGRSAELQHWLIRHAAQTGAALPGGEVAVVVSLPAGHVSPDGLADTVAGALADSGLAASRLCLSFTEETLLTSSAALIPELERVRASGVRLCLDNYGMGHSLFALQARIPLDVVRADLATLAMRGDTGLALRVLGVIARTTASFDLALIAGGVSTPELHSAAVDVGVALLNGRELPHDLTVAEAAALIAAHPQPVP